jgi:hypothetical protein
MQILAPHRIGHANRFAGDGWTKRAYSPERNKSGNAVRANFPKWQFDETEKEKGKRIKDVIRKWSYLM